MLKRIVLCAAVAALLAGPGSARAAEVDAAPGEKLAPKKVAEDTNGDGKADRWLTYEAGEITRVEADTNHDGKIDETAHYPGGKLSKVEKDSDYDGKIDKWIEY